MKRFFRLMLRIWRQQLKLYVYAAIIGCLVGILLLAPSYDYIYAREQAADPLSSIAYVLNQIVGAFTGKTAPDNRMLLMFYGEIGAMLGVVFLLLYMTVHKQLQQIEHLKAELDKDLPSIIRQGEGPYLEFKSSLRWDYAESRINRNLETVVLKTLAGFLNSHIGGVLLIGVADNGEILGLEKDYQSLKRPNQDGFEQTVMTLVSSSLGADLCPFIHILFHVIDNQDVCRLIVSPASRPVFLEQGGMPRFFARTGGATRDLNIQEALAYVAGRWKSGK